MADAGRPANAGELLLCGSSFTTRTQHVDHPLSSPMLRPSGSTAEVPRGQGLPRSSTLIAIQQSPVQGALCELHAASRDLVIPVPGAGELSRVGSRCLLVMIDDIA
jgi:hypothetical protein